MSLIRGRITGWGNYAPPTIITNDELIARTGASVDNEWIVRRSGVEQRRFSMDTDTTASMALKAGRQALDQAGLAPEALDLIILATTTPDHMAPATSSVLQHELGAKCPAFLMMTGCTGFVYALANAYQFIGTGAYRRIMVVASEGLSRFLRWDDFGTSVLFGDGAGAVIIEATEDDCGLYSFDLGSDGSGAPHISIPTGAVDSQFVPEEVSSAELRIAMNGREVFKFATRVMSEASDAVLSKAGLTYDDIDWIIPHQANIRIIRAAARAAQLPMDKFIVNVDKYGNTSCASIPTALSENVNSGKIKPNDRLLFVSFGAGLTWASTIVQMAPSMAPAEPMIPTDVIREKVLV